TYVDSSDVVRFDNLTPKIINDDLISGNATRPGISPLWLPYSPHTIGPADAFRTIYVRTWLNKRLSESAQSSKLKARSSKSYRNQPPFQLSASGFQLLCNATDWVFSEESNY
ncbi:MAG: hypothetical protein U9N58_05495, partial [Thermodesulfobacteriota bacterium]|nr:hypothetical protein [Thermodesulfobacteriota bacterium]